MESSDTMEKAGDSRDQGSKESNRVDMHELGARHTGAQIT